MSNMLLFLWAWISVSVAEPIVVRVALDDRQYKRVTDPVVIIDEVETAFVDDGTAVADVPNDQIYVAELNVDRSETFAIQIRDASGMIGTIDVSAPSVAIATYQLKVTASGVVLDLNAPPMPTEQGVGTQSSISQALKDSATSGSIGLGGDVLPVLASGVEGQRTTAGLMELQVTLDTRLRAVKRPLVKVVGDVENQDMLDDGQFSFDVAGDKVFAAKIQTAPTETLVLLVSDGANPIGLVKVALPSDPICAISLQYTKNGMEDNSDGTPVFQATAEGASIEATDFLQLQIGLEDGQKDLRNPRLRIGAKRVVDLKDDGQGKDATAGDSVFSAQTQLDYAPFIRLTLLDGTTEVGQAVAFLPQNTKAVLKMKREAAGLVVPTVVNGEELLGQNGKEAISVQAVEIEDNSGAANALVLLVSLNSKQRTLRDPSVRILGGEQVPLLDDGTLERDTAGDKVYFARVELIPSETLTLSVLDRNDPIGLVKVAVPSAAAALVTLYFSQYGLSAEEKRDADGDSQLILQAAPKGVDISSSSGDDRISLSIVLNDKTMNSLAVPVLQLNQDGFEPVEFRDDGMDGDSEQNDRIFVAKAIIEREEFVQMMLVDGEETVGQLTIFLPSTSEAVVRIRTSENGIKMTTEPQSSQGASGGSTTTSTVAVSSDALAHVLWVAIALFALAFGYVRQVVQRYWTTEIFPRLKRLDAFLDAQEKKDDSE